MTKESCIVERLFIERIGKKVYFQISLPINTKKVIGLEFGANGSSGVLLPSPSAAEVGSHAILSNKAIGKISLQVSGKENIFFQKTIVEDRNIGMGEFFSTGLPCSNWSHGRKREEWPVDVEEHTMIEGLFQDSWGEGEFEWLQYTFNLYVWIEKCTQ
jgi:hypothetical protein